MAAEVCATGARLAGVVDCWAAGPPGYDRPRHRRSDLLLGAAPARRTRWRASTTVRPLPIVIAPRGDRPACSPTTSVDPARSFSIGAAEVLPQEHPGLPDQPRRRRRRPVRCPTCCWPSCRAGIRTRRRDPVGRAVRPRPTFRRRSPTTPPEAGGCPTARGPGHRRSRPHGPDARRGGLLVARRPARAGRTFRRSRHPEHWLEEVDATDRSEHDRRRAPTPRGHARPSATTSSCSRPTSATPTRSARAVDAAFARFGQVDIVIHGAANVGPSAFGPVVDTGPSVIANQISPKLRGLDLPHGGDGGPGAERGGSSTRRSRRCSAGSASPPTPARTRCSTASPIARWAARGCQHRLGRVGQRGRGADGRRCPTRSSRRRARPRFLRLLARAGRPRVVVAVGDLEARLESWVRRSQPATAGGGGERHPRPNLTTPFVEASSRDRTHPRRDLGLPARARARSGSTIGSSTSAATRCWRCRWRRRSATASRSRCRCSSCSRRRRSQSWPSWSTRPC